MSVQNSGVGMITDDNPYGFTQPSINASPERAQELASKLLRTHQRDGVHRGLFSQVEKSHQLVETIQSGIKPLQHVRDDFNKLIDSVKASIQSAERTALFSTTLVDEIVRFDHQFFDLYNRATPQMDQHKEAIQNGRLRVKTDTVATLPPTILNTLEKFGFGKTPHLQTFLNEYHFTTWNCHLALKEWIETWNEIVDKGGEYLTIRRTLSEKLPKKHRTPSPVLLLAKQMAPPTSTEKPSVDTSEIEEELLNEKGDGILPKNFSDGKAKVNRAFEQFEAALISANETKKSLDDLNGALKFRISPASRVQPLFSDWKSIETLQRDLLQIDKDVLQRVNLLQERKKDLDVWFVGENPETSSNKVELIPTLERMGMGTHYMWTNVLAEIGLLFKRYTETQESYTKLCREVKSEKSNAKMSFDAICWTLETGTMPLGIWEGGKFNFWQLGGYTYLSRKADELPNDPPPDEGESE